MSEGGKKQVDHVDVFIAEISTRIPQMEATLENFVKGMQELQRRQHDTEKDVVRLQALEGIVHRIEAIESDLKSVNADLQSLRLEQLKDFHELDKGATKDRTKYDIMYTAIVSVSAIVLAKIAEWMFKKV